MSMSVGSTAPELGPASAPAGTAASAPAGRPSFDRETLGDRPIDARRVLIVEPDAGPRGLLQLGLIREGFQVAALASAEEAERHLTEGLLLPGLVVAEVGLGGSDGIALCQRLRAHTRLRDVPVLLLAAHPSVGEMEAAGRAGADDYLPKPLFVADLVSLVRLRAGRVARDATLESSTDVLPLSAALRALLTGSSSGRLLLEPGGQLLFRRGEVVSVRFEGVEGEQGLTRMLCLGRGPYRIHLGPVLARGEVSVGVRELCGRLGNELLLWERLVAVSVPVEAVLQPDFEALRAVLPDLPREAEALLRLFDGKRTVREVILASPLTEVATLSSASRLYALGVLLPEVLARSAVRAPYRPTGWEALEQAPASEAVSIQAPLPQPRPEVAPDAPEPEADELATPARRSFKPPSAPAAPPELHQPEESPLEAAARSLARVYQPTLPEVEAVSEDAWADDITGAGLRRPGAQRMLLIALAAGVFLVVGAVALFRGASSPDPAPAAAREPPEPAVETAPPKLTMPAPSEPAPPAASPPAASGEPAPAVGHTLAEGIALYRAALPSAAVRVLDEVVQQTPDSAVAWLYLALARFDAGDVRGAEGAAMKAVALDPKEPRAHLLLAGIHLGRGDRAKASTELQRVLALEPEGPEADDARRLLGSLRDVR
jgi:DNA-binding response OmpR family regulator/tetratricopeptide (TPR) repeat protein